MKKLSYFLAILLMCLPFLANGVETMQESMQDLKNDAERKANQKMNRLEEAVCLKSETECLKQKAENRMQESTDAVVDKYEEITNVIDDE
ncbi:MAG: hypothetical protein H6936_01550 [Burkholderiales bacterium]|nr:hypothetical protein [Nitrosomonas sp.]MCP5273541.1 hypothetical protein [Burkholderiales bacterium]